MESPRSLSIRTRARSRPLTISQHTARARRISGVNATSGGGSGAANAATPEQVIPFTRGLPSPTQVVGQVPQSYVQGSGTIVTGTAADRAQAAAVATYPGGTVDRVVLLSSGDYEVDMIAVNWPHHVFVSSDFNVMGAE